MTIKARNRLTFVFMTISLVVLILALVAVGYKYIRNTFIFPEVYIKNTSDSLLLAYNPNCVIISILILLAYVPVTASVLYRSFEKSQATDMLFFLVFLGSCLLDTVRIVISSIQYVNSYSNLLLKIGNIILFARILAPISLLGTTVLSHEDFKQNADQNCLITIIAAMFFAEIVPLNTAIILPNFSISYGYLKIIRYLSLIICIVSTFALFINNKKNEYSQFMTLGFLILCIGYSILFESYNILTTITGPLLLGAGTAIYLSEVHKHYLWQD